MDVTAVIPVFNALKYVGDAIESIYEQTTKVDEIICIDDCSTDGTLELLTKTFPGVKTIKNTQNMGPAYSRNIGIKEAKGRLIAFLDADDTWAKDKIEWQKSEILKDESLMIIGANTILFSEKSNDMNSDIVSEHFNAYLGSLLVKKEVFQTIGYFDEKLRLSEDQDWFLRVREGRVPYKIVDRVALYKREHDTNMTKDLKFADSGFIKALKQSIDRRRASDQLSNLDHL